MPTDSISFESDDAIGRIENSIAGVKDTSMVGKSKYARIKDDAYYTRDIVCLDALNWGIVGLLPPDSKIWEPFSGGGHITQYFLNRNHMVLDTDINHDDDEYVHNYYDDPEFGFDTGYNNIITNPPFTVALAEEFVRNIVKKLENTSSHEQPITVAVLLRNEWDSAGTRLDIFGSPVFRRKIVITKRPRWHVVTEESKSPRHNYSWFIFSNIDAGTPPVIKHYHPSIDTQVYEKVGSKIVRHYKEFGKEYIY